MKSWAVQCLDFLFGHVFFLFVCAVLAEHVCFVGVGLIYFGGVVDVALALDALDHILHDMNVEGDAGGTNPGAFNHFKAILLPETTSTAKTPLLEVNDKILIGIAMLSFQCNLLW